MGRADGLYLVAGVEGGLTGSYAPYIAVAFVGLVVLNTLTRGRRERFRQQTQLPPRPGRRVKAALAPVELAYLAAGADHAGLVAYLCLVDRGLVRSSADVSGRRSVRAAGPLPDGLHSLEQAAFRQLEADPRVDSFLPAMRRSREMSTMDRQLTAGGLIRDGSDGQDPAEKATFILVGLVMVPVFGIVTLAELTTSGFSPILLGLLVAGALTAARMYRSFAGPAGRPALTWQGRDALEAARRSSFVVGPPDLPGRSGVNIVLIAASMPAVAWDQAPEHVRFLGYPEPARLQLGSVNTDPRRGRLRGGRIGGPHGGGSSPGGPGGGGGGGA